MKPAGHVTRVDVVRRTDAAPLSDRAFLSLHRLELENVYPDGAVSRRYAYDVVLRRYLDAVLSAITMLPAPLVREGLEALADDATFSYKMRAKFREAIWRLREPRA